MNNGIIKLMANTEQLKVGSSAYEKHLDKLRSKLLDAFSAITLPGKYIFLFIVGIIEIIN